MQRDGDGARVAGALAALALATLLLAAGVAPTVVAATTGDVDRDGSASVEAADRASAALAQTNETGTAVNETGTAVRHHDPDEREEDGDLDALQGWLAGRMGDRLVESSVQLSQGEYELARSAIDEEYRSQLGKYVDVAGETEEESDDRTGETFERARERQETLAGDVEQYRETREEYEAARRSGNETRARLLARELDRIATDVNETGTLLVDDYGSLSNATGVDLEPAERNIENETANVTSQQAEIREETFVATDLTADADADTTSFPDPLEVTGRLTTANGTPLADRRIVLPVPGGRVTATTGANGEFSLDFRPTLAPAGDVALELRYVPRNESIYLGSDASVNATVEQVAPSITVSNHTASAGFGDRVGASGTVTVEGVDVAGVPVALAVDGVEVGTAETGEDGSFDVAGALPADVRGGERRLAVFLPFSGRALAPANATAPVTVERTETTLSVSAEQRDGRALVVDGRLRTADGEPVSGQPVRILLNDTVATTATTGSNGTVATNVTVPPSLVADGDDVTVSVAAEFDGTGSNLASANASTALVLDLPGGGPGDPSTGESGLFGLGVPGEGWLALALGLVLVAGAAYWYLSRRDGRVVEPADDVDPDGPAVPDEASADPETTSLVELARERLRDGRTEDAVEVGYGAARRRLESGLGLAPTRTHWEFYRGCRDADLDADSLDALRGLTERYERAAFTAERVSTDAADEAVELAGSIVDSARGGSAPTSDD